MPIERLSMNSTLDITFECLPLRSITRFDVPLDAPPEYEAFVQRVKQATEKHGLHNSYYVHDARCVYRLTNSADVGMLEFRFEGTVLTDSEDRKTVRCDLEVKLARETCDWITAPIVAWFAETVSRAVQVEFDRYIDSGDLHKTIERIERLQRQSDSQGGFVGMGL